MNRMEYACCRFCQKTWKLSIDDFYFEQGFVFSFRCDPCEDDSTDDIVEIFNREGDFIKAFPDFASFDIASSQSI